jgi:hypothetical protein
MIHRFAPIPLAAALLLGACDRAADGPAATPEPSLAALQSDPGARSARAHDTQPVVYHVRSEEDPAFPPDEAVCAAAPFAVNVRLGASLWAEATDAARGQVRATTRRVGVATACVRITDPTFAPGAPQPFYARFELPEGAVTAEGACSIVSNDVPSPGLVLAGCFLRATEVPYGYVGGAVTSLSVFNPADLPGFTTGSRWTVQLYPTPR